MRLLIAGAGGHGRVVAEAALAGGRYVEVAFVDDRFPRVETPEGWPVLGNLAALESLWERYDAFVACFGEAHLRQRVLERALALGWDCPPIVHAAATVSDHATLGPGAVVVAGAVINIGAALGAGCIVNTGASIDHDCELGPMVHICPGARVAGNVRIGARTWFGIGAVARQGITIGRDVMVGAGTVVVRDLPDNVTVVGNPARELHR